ncbi:MAG: DNA polymerase I [Planctomycetota bacterium]
MTPATPTLDPPDATVYLIDGHAQMFRSYFAIRTGMTSPVTGEPTNALFAFSAMLLKLFRELKPRYAAMAVDRSSKTFRHEIDPDYKGTRPDAPEDFKQQVPRMIEVAQAFGLPILGEDLAEADDILATLAVRLTGEHDQARVRLVSKDKDLEQVLSERVTLFDIHTGDEMDPEGLWIKKKIRPGIAVDYQALVGDSTDNVPGVPGIGPKTAAALLERFGSLTTLVASTDQLKGKQKERLEESIANGQLDRSRRLVELRQDVDGGFDLSASRVGVDRMDGPRLRELFRELGFNRMSAELDELLGGTGRGEPKPAKPAKEKTDTDAEAPAFGLFAQEGEQTHGEAAPVRIEAQGDYRCLTTAEALEQAAQAIRKAGRVAVDTETVGLERGSAMCGLCLSWETGAGVYVPVLGPAGSEVASAEAVRKALGPVLADASIAKVGHHFKFDLHVLRAAGFEVAGEVFDTMVAAFLCGAPGLGMDDLALSLLGRRCVPITALIGPKPRRKTDPAQITMAEVALDVATIYSAEDADVTLQLFEHLSPVLEERGLNGLADEVEMPLVAVLADMEHAGIRVDRAELDAQTAELEGRIETLRAELMERAGREVNPDSPKQLAVLLFEEMKFPAQRKTKTGYSTDSETLEKLAALSDDELADVPEPARAFPARLLEYRMLTKLVRAYLSTLTESIGDDERVHTRFHQTGAATGRLSSSDPNLQSIPIRTEIGRRLRKAFVAGPGGVLLAADYSQIELRMLAHLSGDAALVEAFAQGRDIHRAVASQVFGVAEDDVTGEQRGHAKTINFGIIYGITAFGLARRVEGMGRAEAAELIDGYRKRFAGIDRFLESCVDQARDKGYVTTILGRRRDIAGVDSRNPQERALAERLAINSVVQGSAADLIKKAMVALHDRLTGAAPGARMLLQVHDELVVESPVDQADAAAQALRVEMESAMTLRVPLVVELGRGASWFDAK